MSWYGASRVVRAWAQKERDGAAGVAPEQTAALRQAMRIFDRATLQAVLAEHAASVLDAVAWALEERGRDADTPESRR